MTGHAHIIIMHHAFLHNGECGEEHQRVGVKHKTLMSFYWITCNDLELNLQKLTYEASKSVLGKLCILEIAAMHSLTNKNKQNKRGFVAASLGSSPKLWFLLPVRVTT